MIINGTFKTIHGKNTTIESGDCMNYDRAEKAIGFFRKDRLMQLNNSRNVSLPLELETDRVAFKNMALVMATLSGLSVEVDCSNEHVFLANFFNNRGS
ncbi:MAG: hypothetical protein NTY33_01060 [Candidatus Moranbacteria bacterium]|nr:hypothetical protein [Candidatus Moranbacteria bacterium]